MHRDWLAMEHYRLHSIEHWPESPAKAARIAAIHSTLESLAQTAPANEPPFQCACCMSGRRKGTLVQFPEPAAAYTLPKAA